MNKHKMFLLGTTAIAHTLFIVPAQADMLSQLNSISQMNDIYLEPEINCDENIQGKKKPVYSFSRFDPKTEIKSPCPDPVPQPIQPVKAKSSHSFPSFNNIPDLDDIPDMVAPYPAPEPAPEPAPYPAPEPAPEPAPFPAPEPFPAPFPEPFQQEGL